MPGKNLMNRLQQAVLALYDYDDAPDNISVENTLEQGLNILAKLPSICLLYTSVLYAMGLRIADMLWWRSTAAVSGHSFLLLKIVKLLLSVSPRQYPCATLSL